MIIPFSVEPYQVTTEFAYCGEICPSMPQFPLLSIGTDSYVVSSEIQSRINLDFANGCHNLQIGRYCSLADKIEFLIDLSHDYQSVTTGTLRALKQESGYGYSPFKIKRKGQILIENDVWIGHGATILSGVTIHSGAVIAAGAMVTKDVPPYAIVGGNPAKVIKYRFEPSQIESLLEIQWWNWSQEKLAAYRKDFALPIQQFIDKHLPVALQMKSNLSCAYQKTKKLMLLIADYEDPYPICTKVIQEYCEKAEKLSDWQFMIFLKENEATEENIQKTTALLDRFYQGNGDVVIQTGYEKEIKGYLSIADCLVTTRNVFTVQYTSFAYLYHVQILSGVDIPVFDV